MSIYCLAFQSSDYQEFHKPNIHAGSGRKEESARKDEEN